MKTQNLVLRFFILFTIGIAFIILVSMVFSSCKNEQSGAPGTLQLKASSNQTLKSATIAFVNGASITLDAAKVEIKNLRIEENSGNDNQSGNQSGNDGKDGNEKSSKSEAGDAGDIILAGPYLVDILSGTGSIDQVTVLPGTYKKVDFDFATGSENNGHSIVLSGTFTNALGTAIPFKLTSEIAETVQLPLAGNGVQIISGGIVSISILFDVNNWINKLDLNTAAVNNGEIIINSSENQELYLTFKTEVMKNIEAKD
ncbi:MAG: hypothetical protein WAO52_14530 [Prolixibacteraceae bacterium]